MMYLHGQVRGVRTRNAGNYTFYYLVVEDDNLRTHDVQLNRDNEESGYPEKFKALTGKRVSVPIYIRSYNRKGGGEGWSLNYEGNKLPEILDDAKVRAA